MNSGKTPAQIIGLIASQKSEDELLLEEMADTLVGADGMTFRQRKAAQKLARRRELLAEATRLAEENAKAAADQERNRSKIRERIVAAEREWRAAHEAARALPLWAPDGGQRLAALHHELVETCDPRLRELQAWLEREVGVTRAYGPPLEISDGERREGAGIAGFRQDVLKALEQRLIAIREAMAATSAAMLEALAEQELGAKVEQILALVPPIPDGASQQAPLPAPLTIDGRMPGSHVQKHETGISELSEQYKRAANSDRRSRR